MLQLRVGCGIELHPYSRFKVTDRAIDHRKDGRALSSVTKVKRGCAGNAMLGQRRIEGCLRLSCREELRRVRAVREIK